MSMIQIPDELFAKIAAHATQKGISVNEIVTQWLAADIAHTDAETVDAPGYDPTTDPLAQWIGAFDLGDEPGWIERHDEIVGSLKR